MSKSPRQFEMQIDLSASPDVVWEALTQPEIVQRWFATEARLSPGVGGEIVWNWDDRHTWPQKIQVWEPGSLLVTDYDSGTPNPDGSPHPITMEFRLEGDGGRTTLRLVHSGFGPQADFDAEYDGISRGWPVELRSLRLYLEYHRGEERQLTWSTAQIDQPFAEAWPRLTGPEGLACGADIISLSEGEPFDFEMPTGERFQGEALTCHSNEFTGIARSHGNGFLRVCLENCSGTSQVWIWLATYGRSEAEVAVRQQQWDAIVARLFPSRVASPRIGS